MARQKSADSSPAQPATPKAPKKTRWYKNIWQAYTMTRETDRAVTWWMLGTFFGVMAVAVGLGLLWGPGRIGYMIFVGVPFAVLAALILLVRRFEASQYKKIAGQPGAALSALKTIRRGWEFPEEPVAMDMRTQDLVFRGVGRPGVVLVSEGPPQRAARLLEQERKKINRVLSTVPVTLVQCGDGQGQVPLRKLARKVSRLRPTLSKQAAAEVTKRLKALGGVRMPVPKGIDPFKVRPDRKGMRGR
jgi:hypothetical protein